MIHNPRFIYVTKNCFKETCGYIKKYKEKKTKTLKVTAPAMDDVAEIVCCDRRNRK